MGSKGKYRGMALLFLAAFLLSSVYAEEVEEEECDIHAYFDEGAMTLDTWKIVLGTIFFVIVLPFIFFEIRFFPVETTAAVLIGSFLMVAFTIISQPVTYEILGEVENLRTIFLLMGMMLMAQYFERELLINKVLNAFLKDNTTMFGYLWRVGLLSFILSALFTNDAVCLIVTPLVLKHWARQNRQTNELETVLLCIATNANIGSSMTIFGNPQMALIASVTDSHPYSRLDLLTCFTYIVLPAVIGYFLNLFFLLMHYNYGCMTKPASPPLLGYDPEEMNMDAVGDEKTQSVENSGTSANSMRLGADRNATKTTERSQNAGDKSTGGCVVNENGTLITSVTVVEENKYNPEEYGPTENKKFHICMCLIMTLVVALFIASTKEVPFDIGLVPMAGAVMMMIADGLMNKRNSLQIIKRIDWDVLLLFFGFFVWLGAFNYTGVPRWFWTKLGLDHNDMVTFEEIALMVSFVIIGSNLFSNVPLCILVLAQLNPCKNQLGMVLYLAWVSTVAGNLTLFGSVANLIVAQKSLQTLKFRLTFWAYLKYGFVTTMIICLLGVGIIYGLLLI
ncbi:silicon efflux transporter LSI3 [Lingula anatina]|uniref:Silicon efflux transporter LSI3 n=1 Tax=Lingula anatina TaxID=7574 RepID=A0A1S3JZB9_LINAN|nr:silicon efflux transporter LSI3 [Lingula anatina]|eukprot:XP_013415632.1 silicon efflux transporter LSI3 [Lingula anatina]